MAVYTVHAPVMRGNGDSYAFVRDGFHLWAFVFGPFWLIWHRLWLALLAYVVMVIGLSVLLTGLHASQSVQMVSMLIVAFLFGFEAASLRRWTLSRRRWRQRAIVVAESPEGAERRFFDRAALADDTRDKPSSRDGYRYSGLSAPHRDVIGLFPRSDSPR